MKASLKTNSIGFKPALKTTRALRSIQIFESVNTMPARFKDFGVRGRTMPIGCFVIRTKAKWGSRFQEESAAKPKSSSRSGLPAPASNAP